MRQFATSHKLDVSNEQGIALAHEIDTLLNLENDKIAKEFDGRCEVDTKSNAHVASIGHDVANLWLVNLRDPNSLSNEMKQHTGEPLLRKAILEFYDTYKKLKDAGDDYAEWHGMYVGNLRYILAEFNRFNNQLEPVDGGWKANGVFKTMIGSVFDKESRYIPSGQKELLEIYCPFHHFTDAFPNYLAKRDDLGAAKKKAINDKLAEMDRVFCQYINALCRLEQPRVIRCVIDERHRRLSLAAHLLAEHPEVFPKKDDWKPEEELRLLLRDVKAATQVPVGPTLQRWSE